MAASRARLWSIVLIAGIGLVCSAKDSTFAEDAVRNVEDRFATSLELRHDFSNLMVVHHDVERSGNQTNNGTHNDHTEHDGDSGQAGHGDEVPGGKHGGGKDGGKQGGGTGGGKHGGGHRSLDLHHLVDAMSKIQHHLEASLSNTLRGVDGHSEHHSNNPIHSDEHNNSHSDGPHPGSGGNHTGPDGEQPGNAGHGKADLPSGQDGGKQGGGKGGGKHGGGHRSLETEHLEALSSSVRGSGGKGGGKCSEDGNGDCMMAENGHGEGGHAVAELYHDKEDHDDDRAQWKPLIIGGACGSVAGLLVGVLGTWMYLKRSSARCDIPSARPSSSLEAEEGKPAAATSPVTGFYMMPVEPTHGLQSYPSTEKYTLEYQSAGDHRV